MTSTEMTSPSRKFELPELTFIIHYRRDSDDRETNLRNVLQFLISNFTSEIIVVCDERKKFTKENIPCWIQDYGTVMLVENDDEFKKSFCFNKAAKVATGSVYCFWDVDVIIEPRFIVYSYLIITKWKTADHYYPFNGTFIDVQKDLIPELVNEDFDLLNELWLENHQWLHFASGESPGGCTMISREAFERMGGYDEQFVGWGFEDTDFLQRSRKVNRVGRMMDKDAICWHMNHDSAIRTENPHYMNNLRRYNHNLA